MCRGKEHGGRRCPNDTNDARRARYHNANLRSKVEAVSTIPISVVKADDGVEKPVRELSDVKDDFSKTLSDFNKFYGEGAAQHRNDEKIRIGDYAREHNLGAEEYAKLIVENDLDESARLKAPPIQQVGALIYELASFEEGFKTDDEIAEIIEQRVKELEEDRNKPISERNGLYYHEHVTLERSRLFEERAQFLKSALEKTGVKFFDKNLDELTTVGSSKAAVEGLKRGLEFIPSHWVERSNENTGRTYPLKVALVGRGRAHYTNSDFHKTNTRTIRRIIDIKPAAFDPTVDPSKRDFYEYEAMLNGFETYEATDGSKVIPMGGMSEGSDYREWVRKSTEWEFGPKKPKGHGWVKAEPVEFDYGSFNDNFDFTVETVTRDDAWYRHPKSNIKTQYTDVSVAKIPNDEDGEDGYNRYETSVTAHEFCHRVERLIPEVASMERDFLNSRKAYDEELVVVTPGEPDEVGFADNFKVVYAGKVYSGRNTYELLTMGVQQLFYGTHGGFVGEAKDEDYRNFVLGLFAAYGKPEKPND